MMRYVLIAQMKMNEETNAQHIHTPKGFSAKRFLTVIRLTRKSIVNDATIETNISRQKTILVLRYLFRNLLRWVEIDAIVFFLIYNFNIFRADIGRSHSQHSGKFHQDTAGLADTDDLAGYSCKRAGLYLYALAFT